MVCLHIYQCIIRAFSSLLFLKSVVLATSGARYSGRLLRETHHLPRSHIHSLWLGE